MKLSELIKNYYCFNCKLKYSGSPTCLYCGKKAKHIGYKPNVSMSHARLNNQEQRKQHRKELTQPWRDGEISREFLDYYPDKKEQMIKEKIITREQANKAKKVWGNDDII